MAQSTKNNKKQNKQQNKKDNKQSHKKKNASKQRSSFCPYVFGIFVLIGAFASIIAYDTHLHNGIFEKSTVGKVLKDTGALPYVEITWYKSMSNSARAYQWLENNVPVYYEVARIYLAPYCELAVDLYKISLGALRNIGESMSELYSQKAPVVAEFVDQYVPGLSDKVYQISVATWDVYVEVYHQSCNFFRTKVFVGYLSPKSLNNVMNETQIAAAKYYSWFHEKVDAYAKIK